MKTLKTATLHKVDMTAVRYSIEVSRHYSIVFFETPYGLISR